jgi:hypothetical protein
MLNDKSKIDWNDKAKPAPALDITIDDRIEDDSYPAGAYNIDEEEDLHG